MKMLKRTRLFLTRTQLYLHCNAIPSSPYERRDLSRKSLQRQEQQILEVYTWLRSLHSALRRKATWLGVQGNLLSRRFEWRWSIPSQWNITPVPAAGDSNTFTIRPAYEKDVGLVSSLNPTHKNSDYGFPQGHIGPSAHWKIANSNIGEYSKYHFFSFP